MIYLIFPLNCALSFVLEKKKFGLIYLLPVLHKNLDTLIPRIFPKSTCLKISAKRKALSLEGSYYFPVWIPLKFKRKKL